MSKPKKLPVIRPGEMKLTAKQIVEMLATKHGDDVFVSECKDGPTQGSTHLRMDGWAMTKSWSNPLSIAYEVKISRSDFIGDEKWRHYLQYCNEFYFVCPAGMIEPSELPPEVGLYYASVTGSRLFIKKRASYRDVQIPENLYRYILMCRTWIDKEYSRTENSQEFWREWMKTRVADAEFGRNASGAISRAYSERVTQVECDQKRLESRIKTLDDVRAMLARLGIDDEYVDTWSVERRLEEAKRIIPDSLCRALDNTERELHRLRGEIAKQLGEPAQELESAVSP